MTNLTEKQLRDVPQTAPRVLYEDDAVTWAQQQVELLRAGRFAVLDIDHIADEIADVAGREYDTLVAALARVLQHLLSWDYQPERRSVSWVLSIKEDRRRVMRQLRKHPGLKARLDEASEEAYESGRFDALRETELPEVLIPEIMPYGWTEVMERAILWPEP